MQSYLRKKIKLPAIAVTVVRVVISTIVVIKVVTVVIVVKVVVIVVLRIGRYTIPVDHHHPCS